MDPHLEFAMAQLKGSVSKALDTLVGRVQELEQDLLLLRGPAIERMNYLERSLQAKVHSLEAEVERLTARVTELEAPYLALAAAHTNATIDAAVDAVYEMGARLAAEGVRDE
jgi:outer membrane murein-binding lipoprotein Lpp